ncbi:MAG: alpha/beta fold hydrolase [Verrucomicrobiota bacterium]|mgnify:CR=1 FL=1
MIKKLLRRTAQVLAIVAAMGVVFLAGLKLFLDVTYFSGYDAKAPLNVQIAEEKKTPAYQWTKFSYDGFRGDRVPVVMAMPKDAPGPFPCVVFLHGIGDDKEFMQRHKLDEPFVKAGFAFVCFDQLMRGERKLKTKFQRSQAAALRVRAAHTVNDTRRLIDYLVTRPDIAADRIYLCGASYGAITGTTATAFDKRIRAAVLIYGGGNLRKLLSADVVREELGRWRFPFYAVAWYFGSVFDPIRYIGQISPRPVLLQNGKADTVVPKTAARALQDAAREPKTILWYEGDHLGKTSDLDVSLALRVLSDALSFLQAEDAKVQAGVPRAGTR